MIQDKTINDLLNLVSKLVDQNTILIEQRESKQDYIIELLEALVESTEEEVEDNDSSELYRTLD